MNYLDDEEPNNTQDELVFIVPATGDDDDSSYEHSEWKGKSQQRQREIQRRQSVYFAAGICLGLILVAGIEGNVFGEFISLFLRLNTAPSPTTKICAMDEACPSMNDLVDPNGRKRHQNGVDISWMLDFAIVGNSKCGTSFLLRYLGKSSPDIYMPPDELCKMSSNKPDELVETFYDQSVIHGKFPGALRSDEDDSRMVLHGLKCPKEIATELGLINYAKFFPDMKFIVTTRHPVLFFQSFYNYRAYGNGELPPPSSLIGACVEGSPYVCNKHCAISTFTQNVCTDRAKFHHFLSRFGKTSMDSKEEMSLLQHSMGIVPIKGKIFLMELEQLKPSNPASRNIPDDLKAFLGLRHDLPELEDVVVAESTRYTDPTRTKYFINICDDEHSQLRKVLVDIGWEASEWILKYFLQSDDVVVSSREEFIALIGKWKEDPCDWK
jgi:hypothetical protein